MLSWKLLCKEYQKNLIMCNELIFNCILNAKSQIINTVDFLEGVKSIILNFRIIVVIWVKD